MSGGDGANALVQIEAGRQAHARQTTTKHKNTTWKVGLMYMCMPPEQHDGIFSAAWADGGWLADADGDDDAPACTPRCLVHGGNRTT